MRASASLFAALLCGPASLAAEPADLKPALDAINAVGKEGLGNAEAAKAWATVVKAGPEALVPILQAMRDDQPTGANWLRTAVDTIAEGETKAGRKLDTAPFGKYLAGSAGSAASRTAAFELIRQADQAAAQAMLPKFLNDPSLELRRAAIEDALKRVRGQTKPATAEEVSALFAAARDKDQVEAIAKELEKLKMPADITKHFGYITRWSLSETFDNTDGVGHAKAYAPETSAERKGWKPTQGSAAYGFIDLNAAVGKKMNAVVYVAADLVAEAETPAEIRVASQNAIKVFLNGKEVFAREEYHHGTRMDQHVAKVTLAKGANTVMLKVAQNDMPYEWAQVWGFAARICDGTGGPLKLQQLVDGKMAPLGELAPAPPKENK